jgi:epoxyqueuosine reductase
MEYLNRKDAVEKRQHPRFLLNSVQSIVVLGTPIQASPLTGSFRIAAFAHYKDYHRQIYSLIEELIRQISEIIEEKPEYKICVDSSPVLERSLAVQAGLGWIGKSSMFISPKVGSLVLLSECLLSWKLPYDKPYPNDRCGKCTRCIDACPQNVSRSSITTIQRNIVYPI